MDQIRGEINPSFGGINPEPIKKNLALLIDVVKMKQADIGLATDGDADRIGVVDAKGNFIDSHRIFTLLLEHFIVYKKWRHWLKRSLAGERWYSLQLTFIGDYGGSEKNTTCYFRRAYAGNRIALL